MLTRHGYRVMVAGDGAEALVLFKARRREIDLVITDLDMPHLAGSELAAMARKVNPDVPIVAISGVQPGKDPRSPGNSMNAFLLKPFTAESMLAVVHGLLHANHPAI
jgi:CheY-like chemotaxis protein